MPATQAIYLRLPNWIGDVCMSLPSLDALLATDVPLVVCARSWARDLLSAYPLSGFIPMNGNWRADRSAVHAYRKQSRHARTRGLLLPDSLSSAMVFRFAGIPCAGYRDDGRSLILRWPFRKPAASVHAVQSWFYLTRRALDTWRLPLDQAEPGEDLALRLAPPHIEAGRRILEDHGLAQTPFVLIAPTATGLHRGRQKVWPHFDTLTRALQSHGYTVLMCPPAPEQAAARQQAPTAQCLPPLSLGGFGTLTRLASLVICNDSGVSHIAAACGARQLTLFGVTDAARTGPWSAQAVCVGGAQAWPAPEIVLSTALSVLQQDKRPA
jgi:heptosyltransferase-2